MRSPDELTVLFRATGRKVTPQRERIFRILHGHPGHPTAESLHAQVLVDLPTVSLKTVYATLGELVELGEIHRLDLGTGSARFDPNVGDHHHLVCDGCGRVHDLVADFAAVTLGPDNEFGFEADTAQIVFRGRCVECRRVRERPEPATGPTPTK